jgi:hypothetical protein
MAERVIYSIIFSFDDWSWDLMGKAYLVRANPFRNRQAAAVRIGVKSVLSGLMSSSGAPSRQSMPRTSKVASLLHQGGYGRADRIGPGRQTQ